MTVAPGPEHHVFVATVGGQWQARGCPLDTAVVGTSSGPLDELKTSLGTMPCEAHAEAQLTYAFDFSTRTAAESAAEAALTSVGRGRGSYIYGEQEVGAVLGALYEAAGRTPPLYSLARELQW
jgi:hypothetical protein